MSLHTLAASAILECRKYFKFKSVVDIGNQRISFNEKLINRKIQNIDPKLDKFLVRPDWRTSPSGSQFYSHIGVNNYKCIDLNSKDGAIIMDMNLNIKKSYSFNEQFDLVINNGTSEHIFDQWQVFENLHNLTKVGGIILNIVPFLLWINHGFFNYNPIIFRDLAYSNNYSFNFMWIGHSDGYFKCFDPFSEVNLETKRSRPLSFFERNNLKLSGKKYSSIESFVYKSLKNKGQLQIVSAYQKNSENEFSTPLQGKWIHNIEINNSDVNLIKYFDQPDTYPQFHS